MNPIEPLLLSVTEAARLLRLQRGKVYLLIEVGALEATRLGKVWRIRASSVQRLFPATKSSTPSPEAKLSKETT